MTVQLSNEYTADGSTSVFNYTFAVLGSFSAVVVKLLVPGETAFDTQVLTDDYTINTSVKQIAFLITPVSGTLVRIERFTQRERQLEYESGSTITARNLNRDADRLTSVDQEIEAMIDDCLTRNDAGDAWDGEGLRSENCAPATTPDGWATLSQVQAILGGVPLELQDNVFFHIVGDGVTTEFVLTDRENVEAAQLFVIRGNGLVQFAEQSLVPPHYRVLNPDDDDYPSGAGGFSVLAFPEAPLAGEEIEVRSLAGVVMVEALPTGSVTSDSIADGAVTIDHLSFDPDGDNRFLVVDSDGEPDLRAITPADMGGFDAQVRTSRLDQMAIPSLDLNLNSKKITSLAAPTAPADAANKSYVDAAAAAIVPASLVFTGAITSLQNMNGGPVAVAMTPTVQSSLAPKLAVLELFISGVQVGPIQSFPSQWFSVVLRFAGQSAIGSANVIGQSADGTVTLYQVQVAVLKVGGGIQVQLFSFPFATTWLAPAVSIFG